MAIRCSKRADGDFHRLAQPFDELEARRRAFVDLPWTSTGVTALDVTAAATAACRFHDLDVTVVGGCTGCTFDGFSHRVRRDPNRHVVAAWRPGSRS